MSACSEKSFGEIREQACTHAQVLNEEVHCIFILKGISFLSVWYVYVLVCPCAYGGIWCVFGIALQLIFGAGSPTELAAQ